MVDMDELREADEKLTDDEKRENVIRLAFAGDRERFEEFCRVLEDFTPAKTAAVLGGSSVTGPSDRALYLAMTVSWQQIFGAHVVDVGDTAP